MDSDRSSSRPAARSRAPSRAGGAKNSALKLMVACLLAEGRSVLSNVPRITDVDTMAEVLRAVGAPRSSGSTNGDLAVTSPAGGRRSCRRRPTSCSRRCGRRSSCSGLLLARCGVGAHAAARRRRLRRPADRLPRQRADAPWVRASSPRTARCAGTVPGGRLVGTRVVLEYPSHTATDNLLDGRGAGQGHDRHRERGQGARGGRPGRHARARWARWCAAPGRRASRSRASTSLLAGAPHRGARPGGGRHVPGGGRHGRAATSRSPTPGPSTWRCCCARSARWAW